MAAVVCLNGICLHRHWDEPAGVCDACTYNSCMHVFFFVQEVTDPTLINTSAHSPLKNRVRPTNLEIDQVTTRLIIDGYAAYYKHSTVNKS